jgi:hypothetical protein
MRPTLRLTVNCSLRIPQSNLRVSLQMCIVALRVAAICLPQQYDDSRLRVSFIDRHGITKVNSPYDCHARGAYGAGPSCPPLRHRASGFAARQASVVLRLARTGQNLPSTNFAHVVGWNGASGSKPPAQFGHSSAAPCHKCTVQIRNWSRWTQRHPSDADEWVRCTECRHVFRLPR